MQNKLIFAVVGTRPEVIKMAPLIIELRAQPGCAVKVVSTGQHRELSRIALDDFGIVPDYDLKVMRPKQSLSGLTARILDGLEGLFADQKPDLVLCHGDTTTAFATALSCQYQRIPIVHIEAGLRSNDMESPFPEENNRRFVAMLASHHFAPTAKEEQNLKREGVAPTSISVVGNTVRDAMNLVLKHLPTPKVADAERNIVVTLHRRENSQESLRSTLDALRRIAMSSANIQVHFPVHPSPTFHEAIRAHLGDLTNVHLLQPLSYPAFLALLLRASLVITDSGGVQEEAAALGKPTIIVRDRTERDDGVGQGIAIRVGQQDANLLESTAYRLLAMKRSMLAPSGAIMSTAHQIACIIWTKVLA